MGGGTGRIESSLAWGDPRGNLTERQDGKLTPAVSEVFLSGGAPGNDALGRLDQSTRNGTQNFDVTLDAIGNITAKDGLGYVYTGNQAGCTYHAHPQPRAVRKVGATVHCYDANGNLVKRGGSSISYASYNLPTVINQGSNSSTLSYGAFRNRFKQVAVSGGTTETTFYVGGLFERVTRPSGDIEYRHYIPGGAGIAAIHTRRASGTNSTFYWHADHLGSPELFTDSAGTALVRPSFGAYGERRDGSDWQGPPSAADLTTLGNITRRGFTGHEHLDSVGLIHMHGRVYDPAIGRFLSRDPLIDGVFDSQGPNGYAYVHNNPLTFIDPSGFACDQPGRREATDECDDACGPLGCRTYWPEISISMDRQGRPLNLRQPGTGVMYGVADAFWDSTVGGTDEIIDPAVYFPTLLESIRDNAQLELRAGAFASLSFSFLRVVNIDIDLDAGSVNKDLVSGDKTITTGIEFSGDIGGFGIELVAFKRRIPAAEQPGLLYHSESQNSAKVLIPFIVERATQRKLGDTGVGAGFGVGGNLSIDGLKILIEQLFGKEEAK